MATTTPDVPPSASPISAAVVPRGPIRRLSAFLFRHPRLKLGVTLSPPLAWMLLVYLASLVFLLLNAFWTYDAFLGTTERVWTLANIQKIFEIEVYRTIAFRTLFMAAAVTVTDVLIAFPLAYFMARIATPRGRSILLMVVVMPLWISYLVRAFAWQTILASGGLLNWLAHGVGLNLDLGNTNWAVWLVFSYLWLPFVILPIYAALERIPGSFLEASSDLGARGWLTFRRIIWPLALPGIVAGSIFSFSLTLGDYIAPRLVGDTQFIGNVVYSSAGISGNIPFAAAYALVPVVIIVGYLALARKLGAFEAL